jgi:hypothetical protein
MLVIRLAFVTAIILLAACGPEEERKCTAATTDLTSDPLNCGTCGNTCGDNFACIDGRCLEGLCQPGTVEECYNGAEDTLGVGPCKGGTRVCGRTGAWGACEGETLPAAENCTDAVDNNCNGMVDEDVDLDMDGYTTCGVPGVIAGDCCDASECTKPETVNPGAFDAAGNGVDDNCDGIIDNTVLLCDQNLNSNSTDGFDFAKAIDICQTTTEQGTGWGVIDAKVTLTNGSGVPDKEGYAIRSRFGSGVLPQGGVSLAMISSGGAAGKFDTNPGYHPWVSYSHTGVNSAPFPADWFAANNNQIPNAPGCPQPSGSQANDPVMLTFRIRVPENARSFSISLNFFSAEFPEYTCTQFNDFFVILLDSMYNSTGGPQPNPADKNLAFYTPMGTMDKVPVGVNLAYGNTGLFTQCENGTVGCFGTQGPINTCVSTAHLAGTGFDDPGIACGASTLTGGGTGWLRTAGNVVPGEIITLRIAIWDMTDTAWDSIAIIDGFAWSTELANPGTVIF